MTVYLRQTPTSTDTRSAGRCRIRVLFVLLALGVAGCGECDKDFDCPGGQVCNKRRSECEALVCSRDGDCAPGQLCRANRCRAGREDAGPAPDAVVLSSG
jgi:hypothetical protein